MGTCSLSSRGGGGGKEGGIFHETGPRYGGSRAEEGGGGERVPPEPLLFFLITSEKCRCQQRNAVNKMECTGEVDQTSKAVQFLNEHYSTWKNTHRIFIISISVRL